MPLNEFCLNDTQILTIALASVLSVLAVFMGILINNSRLSDLRAHIDSRFGDVDKRFHEVDRRFDDMKEMWRTELHRVEEILDACLKHLEARCSALISY